MGVSTIQDLPCNHAFVFRRTIYRKINQQQTDNVRVLTKRPGTITTFDLFTEVRPCSEAYVIGCLQTIAIRDAEQ